MGILRGAGHGFGEKVPWRLSWVAQLSVLAGLAALTLSRLDHFAWSDDEAVFILTARAVQEGSKLYDDVWFNYLPGFIQLLRSAFAIGGFSLATARIAVTCCALVALALVAGFGRGLGSPWAGVFGALLLATAPHFVAMSSAVMAEIPAAGFAAAAVLAACSYYRSGERWRLALGGLAFCASLWCKPTTAFAGIGLLVVPWLREGTMRRRLAGTALLVASVAVPLLVGISLCNPEGLVRQFGTTWIRSRAAFRPDVSGNLRDLVEYFLRDKYLLSHLSWLVLGAWGGFHLWRRQRTEGILLGLWLGGVAATLLLHAPLYRHHLVQLLIPLSVLAGLGLERGVVALRGGGAPRELILPGLTLAVVALELGASLWVSIVRLPGLELDNAELGQEAVRLIREATRSDEYVITDAHMIALRSGRPVPPELTNTSRMRIRTGQLTDQQVIDIARRTDAGAIVFWEKKLDSLDDFATWVACRYDLVVQFSERHRIYRRRPPAASHGADVPLMMGFGQSIRLLGYSVQPAEVRVGEPVEFTLYWKAIRRPERDYKVFVHLVDKDNSIVGQDDGTPACGRCPTWIWQPGEVIADSHPLAARHVGAGGPYMLIAGLYDAHTKERASPDHVVLAVFPDLG